MFTLVDIDGEQTIGTFEARTPEVGAAVRTLDAYAAEPTESTVWWRVEKVYWDCRIGTRANKCFITVLVRKVEP